jgi:heme/copper-type cytochrome/quinol oxidase subunit 2
MILHLTCDRCVCVAAGRMLKDNLVLTVCVAVMIVVVVCAVIVFLCVWTIRNNRCNAGMYSRPSEVSVFH